VMNLHTHSTLPLSHLFARATGLVLVAAVASACTAPEESASPSTAAFSSDASAPEASHLVFLNFEGGTITGNFWDDATQDRSRLVSLGARKELAAYDAAPFAPASRSEVIAKV